MNKIILAVVATVFVFMLVSNAILSNLSFYIFSSALAQEKVINKMFLTTITIGVIPYRVSLMIGQLKRWITQIDCERSQE